MQDVVIIDIDSGRELKMHRIIDDTELSIGMYVYLDGYVWSVNNVLTEIKRSSSFGNAVMRTTNIAFLKCLCKE